jgi:hypothetical protein
MTQTIGVPLTMPWRSRPPSAGYPLPRIRSEFYLSSSWLDSCLSAAADVVDPPKQLVTTAQTLYRFNAV